MMVGYPMVAPGSMMPLMLGNLSPSSSSSSSQAPTHKHYNDHGKYNFAALTFCNDVITQMSQPKKNCVIFTHPRNFAHHYPPPPHYHPYHHHHPHPAHYSSWHRLHPLRPVNAHACSWIPHVSSWMMMMVMIIIMMMIITIIMMIIVITVRVQPMPMLVHGSHMCRSSSSSITSSSSMTSYPWPQLQLPWWFY